MTSTTPNYGGRRRWFHCPLSRHGVSCFKRVGKLYLPPGAVYFGCRTCYNLTYQTCNESNSAVPNMANAPMRSGLPNELIDQVSVGGLLVCLNAERLLEKRREKDSRELLSRW